MPKVAETVAELIATLDGIARVEDDRLAILSVAQFRAEGIRDLAWTAAFTQDAPTAEAAQWIVWEASQALGARSASIQDGPAYLVCHRTPGALSDKGLRA